VAIARYAGPSGWSSGSTATRASRTASPTASATISNVRSRALPPSGMTRHRRRRGEDEQASLAPVLLLRRAVKSRTTMLAALAVALAAMPAVATEPDVKAKPVHDVGDPPLAIPSIRRALDGLQRLRLRPGVDVSDVVETTRGRPRTNGE